MQMYVCVGGRHFNYILSFFLFPQVNEQGTPVIYCNESDNQLKNFKPFNLEEYWGQRLVQNIHVTTTHQ